MRRRVEVGNINTKEHSNEEYSKENWQWEYRGAYARLKEDVKLIKEEYAKHLDVGCADGFFTKEYIKRFKETEGWGIDFSDVAIKYASGEEKKEHFMVADCYNLPFDDDFFHMVHAAEILEHLENPELAIKEWSRVLKKGGRLIISTINKAAARQEEHLWAWDMEAVLGMLKKFKVITSTRNFTDSILRIEVKKK